MDEQTDERKDLQMAKWAEGLNLYIPEILCMPYVWLKPFQKEKHNNRIQTYTMTMLFSWYENDLRVITFDPILSSNVMSVTNFHTSFS